MDWPALPLLLRDMVLFCWLPAFFIVSGFVWLILRGGGGGGR